MNKELLPFLYIAGIFVAVYGSVFVYTSFVRSEPPRSRPFEIIEEEMGIENYTVVEDIPYWTSDVRMVVVEFRENGENWLLEGQFWKDGWDYELERSDLE